ncbi:MAG TPA: hypothetical protein VIZ65_18135 [Cellvibrionaceae bacterium]
MDDKLAAALIAAFISLVVSLFGLFGIRRQISAQREKMEREIEAKRIDRLYELRLKHYPKFFELTSEITKTQLRGAERAAMFLSTRDKIREWRSGEPMLILSKHAIGALYEFELALRKKPQDIKNSEHSHDQIDKVWRLRLRARGALRRDLGLLFGDENEANFNRAKNRDIG